jgi:hypothetical protein
VTLVHAWTPPALLVGKSELDAANSGINFNGLFLHDFGEKDTHDRGHCERADVVVATPAAVQAA